MKIRVKEIEVESIEQMEAKRQMESEEQRERGKNETLLIWD